MKATLSVCALLGSLICSSEVFASGHYLVLGVIVHSGAGKSVALVKSIASGKTLAVREGQKVDESTSLSQVRRKTVEFVMAGEKIMVAVGENTADASAPRMIAPADISDASGQGYAGVEREGAITKVSASVRDHILKNDLSKVLMQAAAVPHYNNGVLSGFSLHDIEPGSVYEQIGIREGDMVTHINGQALNDVAGTIKLLKSLKEEPNASMNLMRNGQPQTLSLVVQ